MKLPTLALASLASLASLLMIPSVRAYGPDGHETVGALADLLLKDDAATTAKIKALLGELKLAQVANIPDQIKAWDQDPSANPFGQHPPEPALLKQLQDFWAANQNPWDGKTGSKKHHIFHYTDVPIDAADYKSATHGKNDDDIVHMIPRCLGVLDGSVPEVNPYKITKPIAVILLAHYVGDLHQPLHVGSAYFEVKTGREFPAGGFLSNAPDALADEGGNNLEFHYLDKGTLVHKSFHSYWDGDAVKLALEDAGIKPEKGAGTLWAEKLRAIEPANWKPAAGTKAKDWAEAWANEILPIAKTAHEKLHFGKLHRKAGDGEPEALGNAYPGSYKAKFEPASTEYVEWSKGVVTDEINKGGRRLALLLQTVLADK